MNQPIKLKDLIPLYAVVFLGFFGFALTITLFVPLVMSSSSSFLPAAMSSSIRASISGALLAMYPLGQFVGSPIIGNLSDYYGRKKVLFISLFLCAVGFGLIALSVTFKNVYILFFSTFFTGLCESNMALSQAIISDKCSDGAQRNKYVGYAYSACSLGYILGPLAGGVIVSWLDYDAAFWIIALIALFVGIWVRWSFNESYTRPQALKLNILQSLLSMKSIFTYKKLSKFYLVNFLIFFAIQGVYRIAPLYFVDVWKPSIRVYTYLIAFVSILCLLANLLLLKRLTKYFSTEKLLSILLITGGILVILLVAYQQIIWFWILFGLAVIPTVMILPTCTTWLSQQASNTEQGTVLGNNQALLVLGEATAAALGGFLAAIALPLPLILMGVILLSLAILVLNYKFK